MGLAALPRQCHEGHLLRGDGLAHEGLHDLVGHAEVAARVQLGLLEEEAVVAAQVAASSAGFAMTWNAGGAVSLMRQYYAKLNQQASACEDSRYV